MYIPEPERDTDKTIASSSRRRILNHWTWYSCPGRIDRGVVRVNEKSKSLVSKKKSKKQLLLVLEMFRKQLDVRSFG